MLKPNLLIALVIVAGPVLAQAPQSSPAAGHLRRVVQPSPTPPPGAMRQLSPDERAELRRQLRQFHKTASKNS